MGRAEQHVRPNRCCPQRRPAAPGRRARPGRPAWPGQPASPGQPAPPGQPAQPGQRAPPGRLRAPGQPAHSGQLFWSSRQPLPRRDRSHHRCQPTSHRDRSRGWRAKIRADGPSHRLARRSFRTFCAEHRRRGRHPAAALASGRCRPGLGQYRPGYRHDHGLRQGSAGRRRRLYEATADCQHPGARASQDPGQIPDLGAWLPHRHHRNPAQRPSRGPASCHAATDIPQ
jgi:hypothetical protein